MHFVSLHFAVFLPIVLGLFFLVPSRHRWLVLLAASWYFYASWNLKYLLLLFYTTAISYAAGLIIGAMPRSRQRNGVTAASALLILAPLIFFKYFDFLNGEAHSLLAGTPLAFEFSPLELLLPIGISFFTFQVLSYVLDVHRGIRPPVLIPGDYALYVAFFPQLVAGPIERSTRLLPQIRALAEAGQGLFAGFKYSRAVSGARLVLTGFFKKIVIADNMAMVADAVYGDPNLFSGGMHLIAIYCFAFQIYFDFSAYTDIARGIGRILGIELMINFRNPYLATSIPDFWRRWHISLTSWFRDYLYIPLGGNQVGILRWTGVVILVFLVSGFWHGPAWTFVAWGAAHGFFYLASRVKDSLLPNPAATRAGGGVLRRLIAIGATFHLVLFAWILFRAQTFADAYFSMGRIVGDLAASVGLTTPSGARFDIIDAFPLYGNGGMIGAILGIVMMESIDLYRHADLPTPTTAEPDQTGDYITRAGSLICASPALRWGGYLGVLLAIIGVGQFGAREFIYFQF